MNKYSKRKLNERNKNTTKQTKRMLVKILSTVQQGVQQIHNKSQ